VDFGENNLTGIGLITGDNHVEGSLTAEAFYIKEGGELTRDHGSLDGLADDDHTQYILADGTRAFTGPLQGDLTVAGHVRFNDTLNVENAVTAEAFYFNSGGEAPQSYVEEFTTSLEWIVNHSLQRPHFIAQAWQDNGLQVIPDTIDVSNHNTAYFYFTTAMAGKAVLFAVG
jgi:hypothetical protein